VRLSEVLIVLLIVVVLFGGTKLPQLGSGLGNGLRNFKRAMEGKDEEPAPPPGQSATPKDGARQPTQGK
jgi:sec-independent protein translocase protein TatA